MIEVLAVQLGASASGAADRVRLFRADTPHDVAAACLIAGSDPGQDILAISTDMAATTAPDYLAVMTGIALAYEWAAIVDISDLPMNQHWVRSTRRSSRWTRYRDMQRSYDMLRDMISASVPVDEITDLFLSCLDHPDVQLLSQVIPAARISYLPHGLGSIHAAENATCVRWSTPPPRLKRIRHLVTRSLKVPIWGPAVAPPLWFDISSAYTVALYPAFGRTRI